MQYPNFIKFILYTCLSITIFGCKKKNNDGEYVAYFGGEIVNPNSRVVLFCKDDNVIDTIKLDKNNRFFIKFNSWLQECILLDMNQNINMSILTKMIA